MIKKLLYSLFTYNDNLIKSMKITTKTLDETLLLLKNESDFGSGEYTRKNLSVTEEKLIVRALIKLEKDGYAYSEKTVPNNELSKNYYISFDGLLALENAPLVWKDKPYQYKKAKEIFRIIWSVIKVVAVISNGLFILYFTYLTYLKG